MILKDRIRQLLNMRKLAFTVKDKGEWVTVFIELDRKGNGFTFSMVGSFVDGGHYWSSPGSNWRSFLKSLDCDYFGGKILAGGYRVFDPDATLTHARQKIIQWRKEGHLNEEQARSMWDELRLREDDLMHECQLFEWLSQYCDDPYDITELVRRSPHKDFTAFYKRLWPKVLARL